MTLDEKDLEIARLKGMVAALEGELAKERIMRLAPPALNPFGLGPLVPAVPTPQPPFLPGILPWTPTPIIPTPAPIWPPIWPPPVIFGEWPSTCGPNINCCNPTTLFGGKVWVGETRPSLETLVAFSQGKPLGTS